MKLKNSTARQSADLYRRDYAEWLDAQSDALRNGRYDHLDIANLVEELEDLGKNQRREVESRLETLIEHVVKLAVCATEGPRTGWRASVREQRRQLAKLFRDSPSLRKHANEIFPDALKAGQREAWESLKDNEPALADQYKIRIAAFCEFIRIDQILDDVLPFEVVGQG